MPADAAKENTEAGAIDLSSPDVSAAAAIVKPASTECEFSPPQQVDQTDDLASRARSPAEMSGSIDSDVKVPEEYNQTVLPQTRDKLESFQQY